MPRDTAGSLAEGMRAWFAVSIRLPRSPPLEIPCARHLCRHDRESPGCLTRNLTLETHYRCFLSFWREEIGAVVGWLNTQQCSAEGVLRAEHKSRILVKV